ncbi:uncharacterized protein LOC134838265 [Culicoides brevitarsis]|uniref:uncharacterized protein LOC134838265 n=1 Tax=Culicoides brevitarsis TaxID=469753 RepID=UPI00307C3E0E
MPTYTLDELLWRHKDLFLEDFDYRDIRYDRSNPFCHTESETILREETRALQFERMCFIIKYQKFEQRDLTEKFLEVLQLDYSWIALRLRESCNGDPQIEQYRTALYRSDIPKTGDLFVYRLRYLWDVQQAVKALKPEHYLILKSKVGFGKKWIAKDSCANYSVFSVMQNDVFWINLNNCDNDEAIYEKLLKLRLMLNNNDIDYKVQSVDTEHTEHKVDNLKRQLRDILTKYHKHCLLILCGVATIKVLKAFDLGCKTLVTTKNMEIFFETKSSLYRKIDIDKGFTRDEAMLLFHKATRMPEGDLHRHDIASRIYEKCKGHPFIISSIAKSFYDLERSYIKVEDGQWRDWLKKLDNYQIETYDNKENIEKIIGQLKPEHQKLYESLCVFKNDANISFKVLETYWEKSETEVKHIVNCFHKLSLIELSQVRCNEWKNSSPRRGLILIDTSKKIFVCSLHFIYYSYLRKKLTPLEIREMNEKLVKRYGVHALVSDRSEPKMVDIPDDNYFYYYIGHHLLEAEMFDLFPKLYFDFEFLEGKIRATGLPNTLGDLQIYVYQIADDNYQRQQLLHGLMEFLLSIEEILLKSPDTCLLQYAFNSKDSIVSKEAERQICQYRDRVWFRDSDHSHKYRQIVQLPASTNMVKFFNDPNAALSVINNNIILLKDLSLQYPVNSTQFIGHESKVKQIEILDDEYFVSLDEAGHIRLWSIKNTPVSKRINRERNDTQNGNNNPFPSPRQRNYLSFDGTHAFNEYPVYVWKLLCNVKCIHFNDRLGYLLAADRSGMVFAFFRENNTLKMHKLIKFDTKLGDSIHSLVYMDKSGYLVVLNDFGMASFYDMHNFSLAKLTSAWIYVGEKPIGFHYKEDNDGTVIYCVYQTKVFFVRIFFADRRSVLEHQIIMTHDMHETQEILCSTMSDDKNFLMLGTTNGINIIDINRGSYLPCRNLNDEITSIDVFTVDDTRLENILISSTRKNGDFVTLQATTKGENSIEWANDRTSSPSVNIQDLQNPDHLNKSLIGNTVFEVRCVGDDIELILPDDQNRVQLRKSRNNFKPSCTHALSSKVTAVSMSSDCVWIGCCDGKIYEIKDVDSMVPDSIRYKDDHIVYLKCFDKLMLIGTNNYYYIEGSRPEIHKRIATAMEIDNEGTVAVIHTDCSINVFNARKKIIRENIELQGEDFRSAAVSKDNYLMMGLKNNHIYAFNLPFPEETNQYLDFWTEISTHRGLINCMALSADASILAVGFTHGTIEIIKIEKSTPPSFSVIETLNCRESVNDLLFSPWVPDTNANIPIVLVSLSQEISFWNINYVINNPFEKTQNRPVIRRSGRFQQPNPVMSPNRRENSLSASSRFSFNPIVDNLWQNKRGSSDKPELLACLRLSGQAEKIVATEDFRQFVTVDNEGEIYHLRLFDPSTSSPIMPYI